MSTGDGTVQQELRRQRELAAVVSFVYVKT